MLKIGLTGGIGSGKSTACKFLKNHKTYIFDADRIGKRLIQTNERLQHELIAEFGTDIQDGDGSINHKKLARISFQDEDHQLQLNTVVHPFIFDEFYSHYDKITEKDDHAIFVVDGALIFESGLDQHLDFIIVITATMKHRMERALSRGNLTRAEIQKRMDLQWNDDEKVHLADFVIHNDQDEEHLKNQIDEIYSKLV